MRFAIWSHALAISFTSFAVATLGGMFGNIYHYRFGGKPLPSITYFIVDFHLWALAIPFIWLVAAIWLSRPDAVTQNRVYIFTGISTLAISFMFTLTAIALTMPFVSISVSMR